MIIKCTRIAIVMSTFNQIINIKIRVKKKINYIKNRWYILFKQLEQWV